MAEALFYHLTESRLEDALPPLLERSMARGWKVVVQCGSEERRDALDAHLWTFNDESFLAHGLDLEATPELQPILLTTGPGNANGAAIRFFVDGATPGDMTGYERLIFMFDGQDDMQVADAREYWKNVKSSGFSATYWQQKPTREWERKA
jgi:DNA polymerase-3 subunit chi